MTSKHIGNITELEIMLAFIKAGYNVLTPYGDCERYDFVVDNKGIFIKVQCKTAKSVDNGSAFKFNCRSTHKSGGKIIHHKYTKEEIDYFTTYFNGKCYLIPVEECGAEKSLRIFPPKNEQSQCIAWAKDYELEGVLKDW